MGTERILKQETERLRINLAERLERVQTRGGKGKEFLINIQAYLSDTDHFLKNADLIRAFECIVWAWAWLEIGTRYGYLEEE